MALHKPQTEGCEQIRVRFGCGDDEPEKWEYEVHQEYQQESGSETLARPASALILTWMNLMRFRGYGSVNRYSH